MKYGAICIDPEVMRGAPLFAGTCVHVQTLFDYSEGDDDWAEFLDDFPSVSKESALAVLEMAKKICAHRENAASKICLTKVYRGNSKMISE